MAPIKAILSLEPKQCPDSAWGMFGRIDTEWHISRAFTVSDMRKIQSAHKESSNASDKVWVWFQGEACTNV